MRNPKHPDREKVRIDFSKTVLDAASKIARERGTSLSAFIEDIVAEKTGTINGSSKRGMLNNRE